VWTEGTLNSYIDRKHENCVIQNAAIATFGLAYDPREDKSLDIDLPLARDFSTYGMRCKYSGEMVKACGGHTHTYITTKPEKCSGSLDLDAEEEKWMMENRASLEAH